VLEAEQCWSARSLTLAYAGGAGARDDRVIPSPTQRSSQSKAVTLRMTTLANSFPARGSSHAKQLAV
jgi:hypothetical protein